MITPSALEMGTDVRSINKTRRPEPLLRMFARSLAKSRTGNSIRSSKALSGTAPSYRLGEVVQYGQFGTGRVMANWPDGTLLVRFESVVKSRLVSPSLLDRVNSRRS